MTRLRLGALALVFVASAASAGNWQQSTANSAQVRLGIRDKNGEKPSYVADFIVVDATGRSIATRLKVTGDEFGYVLYPQDFTGVDLKAGKYRWAAKVGGREVVGGTFAVGAIGATFAITATDP